MKNLVEISKNLAIAKHTAIGQQYGGEPYSYHLQMVVNIAYKWISLINENDRDDVIAGCWVHDIIEDAGVSYNDLLKQTNYSIAEYAYALSNEKGRNRKERANRQYYYGIRIFKHATFIKLCDRIANVKHSQLTGDSMFKKYQKEYDIFKFELYDGRFEPMWNEVEELLK